MFHTRDEVVARTGVPMGDQPMMASIGAYNQTDCWAMGEMLALLRKR